MRIGSFLERRLARQWIAGPDIAEAIERAKLFNTHKITAMINYLGEDYTGRRKIDDSVATYIALIKEIKRSRAKADISVKPTQLGLMIRPGLFEANYLAIAKYAKRNKIFVWLDMEAPWTIQDTIEVYLRHAPLGNTGICLQSNLVRSMRDAKSLARHKAKIRLVKGAYTPDPSEGYHTRDAVTENYIRIMRYLISRTACQVMVATHDPEIIAVASRLSERRKGITYAMLNGINNTYALHLSQSHMKVYMYIPFGQEWVGYSYRRLKEVGHVSLVMKSLIQNQTI